MLQLISVALCLSSPFVTFSQIETLQLSNSVTKEVVDLPVITLNFDECYILERAHADSVLNYDAYFSGKGTIGIFNDKVEIIYSNSTEIGKYTIDIVSAEGGEEVDRNVHYVTGIIRETKMTCSLALVKDEENKIIDIIFDSDYDGVAKPFASTRRAYPINEY